MDNQTLALLAIAILNAVTAAITWFMRSDLKDVAQNIATVEKHTNSMKDALVAATDKAARAEGTAAGIAQEQAKGDANG